MSFLRTAKAHLLRHEIPQFSVEILWILLKARITIKLNM